MLKARLVRQGPWTYWCAALKGGMMDGAQLQWEGKVVQWNLDIDNFFL